ncbi:hypothetical protein [Burkholderia diffusa]|uniref:hypothetical protein n=1 Tax=Burkholderia diffusa TaxID=488732 RepID=UPI000758AD14|nr:hypothetical protein [Burkholderia diffusa]KVH43276.1 hypothetical protein WJ39_27265 [Burkholderia diffusa]
MKYRIFCYPILVWAIHLCSSTSAVAAIDVIPKDLLINNEATQVQIVNNGDRPEYVSISLLRLLNPGVDLTEERLEPVGEAEHPLLYAYPSRLSLAPGQSKLITIKPLGPVKSETVYRLNVTPVINVVGAPQQQAVADVLVSLSFSTLIHQLPANEKPELSVVCDADGAKLTATGNVRYVVKGAEADGQVLDDFRVYPGVPLPVKGQTVIVPGYAPCRGGKVGRDRTPGTNGAY